jgi:hypothetical protein
MNFEKPASAEPNKVEQKVEHIPTVEEVQNIFKELTGQEFKETRRDKDEKGICFLEAEGEPDAEGYVRQVEYRRRPHPSDLSKDVTTVRCALRDKDGDYLADERCGATASFVDGKWELYP